MGQVVRFRNHQARASASSTGTVRATNAVIVSADRPAAPAISVPRTADHHSAGMLLRCRHFETVQPVSFIPADAATSSAIASRDGQRSMIDLNEVSSDMPNYLGQTVLKSKANVSYDAKIVLSHDLGMDRMSESEEKAAFIQRVKAAREARFSTQAPILTILGIPQGQYKHYEKRTPLPHRFIPKFCAATGVSVEWLLTGEGKGIPEADMPKPAKKRTSSHLKAKAA